MTSLVITIVGPDRPGMVSALSDKAVAYGANWADSLMANFAGQFAGIVQLEVPAKNCDALVAALRMMESPDLRIVITRADAVRTPDATRHLQLELVGHDRPGIIHGISAQLAQYSVSIDKLKTHIASGAMSGEQMFHMNAQLTVPIALDTDALRAGLESLANELMVDITFDSGAGLEQL